MVRSNKMNTSLVFIVDALRCIYDNLPIYAHYAHLTHKSLRLLHVMVNGAIKLGIVRGFDTGTLRAAVVVFTRSSNTNINMVNSMFAATPMQQRVPQHNL